ncbi:hypothetical protein C8R44DRAFT_982248 [Mycena epipterygia]|nr:hypothetical protein C8R44DRAFT_982248 [Mycena epipterygia]
MRTRHFERGDIEVPNWSAERQVETWRALDVVVVADHEAGDSGGEVVARWDADDIARDVMAASTRSLNLKERIAALQERERATSPPLNGHGPTVHVSAPAPAGQLRAKIAQFESKGGVPVPQGSFGLGAPPESAPKRRAELYGNRMQPARIPSAALARPVSHSPTTPIQLNFITK